MADNKYFANGTLGLFYSRQDYGRDPQLVLVYGDKRIEVDALELYVFLEEELRQAVQQAREDPKDRSSLSLHALVRLLELHEKAERRAEAAERRIGEIHKTLHAILAK